MGKVNLLAVVKNVVKHKPRTRNVIEIYRWIALSRMTEEFPSTLSTK
jgi:hypothetical protein